MMDITSSGMDYACLWPMECWSETQPVPKPEVERKNPSQQTPLALQGWQVRKRPCLDTIDGRYTFWPAALHQLLMFDGGAVISPHEIRNDPHFASAKSSHPVRNQCEK